MVNFNLPQQDVSVIRDYLNPKPTNYIKFHEILRSLRSLRMTCGAQGDSSGFALRMTGGAQGDSSGFALRMTGVYPLSLRDASSNRRGTSRVRLYAVWLRVRVRGKQFVKSEESCLCSELQNQTAGGLDRFTQNHRF